MSSTVNVSSRTVARPAPAVGSRKWLVFWIAAVAAIGLMAVTLVYTIGNGDSVSTITPGPNVLQLHHEEGYASAAASEAGARQSAFMRLKGEGAIRSAPEPAVRSEAFQRLKEGE